MIRNKKIILILLTFLVLFMFSSNVFAVVYEYNGSTVELPDVNYNHYVVFNNGSAYYLMVLDDVYSESAYVCKSSNSSYKYCEGVTTENDEYLIKFPYYSLNGDEWKLETSESSWTASPLGVVYSTEDIYYNGEIFFQKAPETITQETTLAKITRESHPEEVLIQILKLIPLILVVVVSFLGFRKAWSLLSNLLHKA